MSVDCDLDDDFEYTSLIPDCILDEDSNDEPKDPLGDAPVQFSQQQLQQHQVVKGQLRNFRKNPQYLPTLQTPKIQLYVTSENDDGHPNKLLDSLKNESLQKCPICTKYFRRISTHMKVHYQEEFDTALLSKHAVAGAASDSEHRCRFCDKSFSSINYLAVHMRTHSGARPFVCSVCQKSFSQSCNLSNHMRTHTGERPFKCQYCDRAFSQSGNLANHVRLHRNERPFRCRYCDRAFAQSGNLASHMRNNHRNLQK